MDRNAWAPGWHAGRGIRLCPPTEPPIIGDPSGRSPAHEASRLRAADHHAERAYPGAIGELLFRELTANAEFDFKVEISGAGSYQVAARSRAEDASQIQTLVHPQVPVPFHDLPLGCHQQAVIEVSGPPSSATMSCALVPSRVVVVCHERYQ